MKRLVLTVYALLLGLFTWAQSNVKGTICNIQIEHEAKAPSCLNGMDGKIILKVSGAKSPYKIHWADGGEGHVLQGASAGLYIATVRDAEGCTKKFELQVPQGSELQGPLDIKTQAQAGNSPISVRFADGSKPASIQIKNLSQGVKAAWTSYQGETLTGSRYLVEAFTAAGCSKIGMVDLSANK